MEDIKLLETCPVCGENITLMESFASDKNYTNWLVKRCLKCSNYRVQEVIQVVDSE